MRQALEWSVKAKTVVSVEPSNGTHKCFNAFMVASARCCPFQAISFNGIDHHHRVIYHDPKLIIKPVTDIWLIGTPVISLHDRQRKQWSQWQRNRPLRSQRAHPRWRTVQSRSDQKTDHQAFTQIVQACFGIALLIEKHVDLNITRQLLLKSTDKRVGSRRPVINSQIWGAFFAATITPGHPSIMAQSGLCGVFSPRFITKQCLPYGWCDHCMSVAIGTCLRSMESSSDLISKPKRISTDQLTGRVFRICSFQRFCDIGTWIHRKRQHQPCVNWFESLLAAYRIHQRIQFPTRFVIA